MARDLGMARPETGGLLLRDLSTNGVGLRSGRNDTMTKAIGDRLFRWGKSIGKQRKSTGFLGKHWNSKNCSF